MRKFLKKVLKILDGTPKPQGKQRQRGQSVLEMTAITPLLIILLVGLVEIGWFARNYLTLLEISRVGARRGAVLGGEFSPINWDEWASLPPGESYDLEWTNYPTVSNPMLYEGKTLSNIANSRVLVRECSMLSNPDFPDMQVGFYNLVLCQMTASLTPLEMRRGDAIPIEDRTDDIVISVFAIQMIHNGTPVVGGDQLLIPNGIRDGEFQQGYIPVVVGRYPTKANECNIWQNSQNPSELRVITTERDPFDFYRQVRDQKTQPSTNTFLDNSTLLTNDAQFNAEFYASLFGSRYNHYLSDSAVNGRYGGVDVVQVYAEQPDGSRVPVGQYPLELAVLRNGVWVSPGNLPAFDPYNYPEMVRGFSFTGYHRVGRDETRTVDVGGVPTSFERLCFGSEFSIYDIQELLLNSQFMLTSAELAATRATRPDFGIICEEDPFGATICRDEDLRAYFPNQGIVLVEVFWQHRLLLDIPVFSPVYNALGSDRTTIRVWSAFPAPSVTPNLKYNLDVENFAAP